MYWIIDLLLSKCDVCQRMNRKLTSGVPELHPIPVKSPWHMIGIDFIGPISPEADDGSHYILTLSDYFTKWVEVVPTADKTASGVAASLYKVNVTTLMFLSTNIIATISRSLSYSQKCNMV